MPKEGRELLKVLFAMVAIAVVVIMPVSYLLKGLHDWRGAASMGMVLATVCGFAFWLAWGGSQVFFRLPIVGIGVVCLCTALGARNEFADIAMITLGTTVVVALPRIAGVRRCRIGSDGALTSARRRQFSIRDLFVWTFTAAILAAIARWSDLSAALSNDRLKLYAVWSIQLGSSALLAAWAMLANGRWAIGRVASAILLMIFVCAGATAFDSSLRKSEATPAVIFATCLLSAVFYALRRRGVRLAQNRSILVSDPAQAESSTASDASPFDAE
jgi:hypothetical protein